MSLFGGCRSLGGLVIMDIPYAQSPSPNLSLRCEVGSLLHHLFTNVLPHGAPLSKQRHVIMDWNHGTMSQSKHPLSLSCFLKGILSQSLS